MELQTIRKKLEEVAHMSQELKNSYLRLNDNEKTQFKQGYKAPMDVDELVNMLYDWSEEQYKMKHGENE
ncbi:hypothetical protein FLK61_30970 [Paenalkalicoccus suaedae]|uniref:Uncharacterized protein n=1 Tax=Paenalkalicoccus suaedae TaxID=2592382 RepID=A0A859FE35_9BACI|nr:hypothetical protein [Paenalkalicoccus suaedae]QKS71140.1 hypothetical protein FLK61_30970 [Paenalkalicoccus suaedae]